MNGLYGVLRRLCVFIVGIVFFLSGVFKLMDPVGTGLIIESYLGFFHMTWLAPAAKAMGVALALTESLCGAALTINVFRRMAGMVASLLTGFFTIITIILVIFNPTFDCGCFGEVVHLTHWQSLAKNIVLCLLLCIAYFPIRGQGDPHKGRYVSFALVSLSLMGFGAYSLCNIPLVDFTPYNSSTLLKAAIGERGEVEKEFVSTFVYEKNGQRGVFTLDKLPDSTWTFVRSEVIEKEDNIKAENYPSLSFRDLDGNYRDTLAAKGEVVTLSFYDAKSLDSRQLSSAAAFIAKVSEAGFRPLLLLASTPEDFAAKVDSLPMADKMTLMSTAYYSDYKTLISLNRSNGGAVYFNGGNLIRKWPARRLPESKTLGRLFRQDSTEVMISADSRGRIAFEAYLLYAFVLMLFV